MTRLVPIAAVALVAAPAAAQAPASLSGWSCKLKTGGTFKMAFQRSLTKVGEGAVIAIDPGGVLPRFGKDARALRRGSSSFNAYDGADNGLVVSASGGTGFGGPLAPTPVTGYLQIRHRGVVTSGECKPATVAVEGAIIIGNSK